VTRGFLEDIAGHKLDRAIHDLDRALLVFHAPEDEIVGVENAARIFGAARHPKSFISLAGADHMLSRPADAAYVARVLAAGVDRYLVPPDQAPDDDAAAWLWPRRDSAASVRRSRRPATGCTPMSRRAWAG
jgi:putative redox protein